MFYLKFLRRKFTFTVEEKPLVIRPFHRQQSCQKKNSLQKEDNQIECKHSFNNVNVTLFA